MITSEEALLIIKAHGIDELLANKHWTEVVTEHRPDLFDAYCSLMCMAGLEIPDPSGDV